MSAPGLRVTESDISCTRLEADSASTALPMRASWNMDTTASLAWPQIWAARCSSAWVVVGRRSRTGGGGSSGSTTLSGGRATSSPKSVARRTSSSSGLTEGLPWATSLPREISIHTSSTAVAQMRSMSLGSVSTNLVRQKG